MLDPCYMGNILLFVFFKVWRRYASIHTYYVLTVCPDIQPVMDPRTW